MGTAAHLIQRERRRASITLSELSRLSGVAVSTLSLYENGLREPSASALSRVLRALGRELVAVEAVPGAADKARVLERVVALGMALPRRERGDLDYPPFHSLRPETA